MGVGASSSVRPDSHGPNLGDLPESCVAAVLRHLDPPDICRVARLNHAFHDASSADQVWEPKLPSNYAYLIMKLLDFKGFSKKDMFAALSRPNPFDGGTKQLWLDKRSGGLFLAISSRAMTITGVDDRRYWTHIPTEESRFKCVAYMQQIWWLEVEGEIEFCFPPGNYDVFFRLQLGRTSRRLGRRVCSTEHVHGWTAKPVQFRVGGGPPLSYFLREPCSWVLYRAGSFTVGAGEPGKISFSMRQIDCTHTKGGLSVDSVLIRPALTS